MQIREFFTDALEVAARNVQSLLMVKIPAVIQIFKIPSKTGGVKKVSTPPITVGGVRTMSSEVGCLKPPQIHLLQQFLIIFWLTPYFEGVATSHYGLTWTPTLNPES